jgi:predicted permease
MVLSPIQDGNVLVIDPRIVATSANATVQLLVAIGLGVWIARRKGQNLLSPQSVETLSKLVYWLFQPSLVFCSVSRTLYDAREGKGGLSSIALAMMPMAAVLHIGLGYLTACLLSRMFRVRSTHDARYILLCCTFGNAAPLPLVYVSSLFSASPVLHADVTACISFYLLAWSPCFYTIGPMLLSHGDDAPTEDDKLDRPYLKSKDDDRYFVEPSAEKFGLSSILTPPIVGSFLGVVVGLAPLLSNALLTPNGLAAAVYNAIHTFSSAYLPSVILVLAGSLAHQAQSRSQQHPCGENLSIESQPTQVPSLLFDKDSSSLDPTRKSYDQPSGRIILCICAARFVVSPCLTALLLSLLQSLVSNAESSGKTLTICSFVVLLESFMPPAQNTVVLLHLQGKREQAGRVSQLLTALYTISLVPIALLLNLILTSTRILRLS